jgi:hypothetical protein
MPAAVFVPLPLGLDPLLQLAGFPRKPEKEAIELLVGLGTDPRVLTPAQAFLAAARDPPEIADALEQPPGLPAQLRLFEPLQATGGRVRPSPFQHRPGQPLGVIEVAPDLREVGAVAGDELFQPEMGHGGVELDLAGGAQQGRVLGAQPRAQHVGADPEDQRHDPQTEDRGGRPDGRPPLIPGGS